MVSYIPMSSTHKVAFFDESFIPFNLIPVPITQPNPNWQFYVWKLSIISN